MAKSAAFRFKRLAGRIAPAVLATALLGGAPPAAAQSGEVVIPPSLLKGGTQTQRVQSPTLAQPQPQTTRPNLLMSPSIGLPGSKAGTSQQIQRLQQMQSGQSKTQPTTTQTAPATSPTLQKLPGGSTGRIGTATSGPGIRVEKAPSDTSTSQQTIDDEIRKTPIRQGSTVTGGGGGGSAPEPYRPPRPGNAPQAQQATQGQGGGAGRATEPPKPDPGPQPMPQPGGPIKIIEKPKDPTPPQPQPRPSAVADLPEGVEPPPPGWRVVVPKPNCSGNVCLTMPPYYVREENYVEQGTQGAPTGGGHTPSTATAISSPAGEPVETPSEEGQTKSAEQEGEPATAESEAETAEPTSPAIATESNEQYYEDHPDQQQYEDEAERARREYERRMRAEAARRAREESAQRATYGLGYADVEPVVGDDTGVRMADPGVSMEMIGRLGALVQQAAVTAGAQAQACFAGLCDEAAKKAAEEAEKALEKARQKAEKAARDKHKDAKDKAEKNRDAAEDEAEDREKKKKRRSPEARRRLELEDEIKEKGEELKEQGDELEERGERLGEEQDRLNEEERRLRREEGELRKNDPNCRSAACKAKQAERAANSRAITDLARETGQFQADQARFQGQMQDYARKADQLSRMKDAGVGMTRDEFRAHQADKINAEARRQVGQLQSNIDDLKRQQQELREAGGSGSSMDKALDREINRLNGQLGQAQETAAKASEQALRANAYAMGLRDEYDAYRSAQDSLSAQRDVQDASKALQDFEVRMVDADEATRKAAAAERQTLLDNLEKANKAVARAGTGSIPEQQQAVGDFVDQYQRAQNYAQMSDSELADQIAIERAAVDYMDRALNGVGGDLPLPGGPVFEEYDSLHKQKAALEGKLENLDKAVQDAMDRGTPVFGGDVAEARQGILDDIAAVEQDLARFGSVDSALQAAKDVQTINAALNDFAKGLPRNADGSINEAMLGQQVQVVGQAQMELSRAAGQLNALQQREAAGGLSAREQAQKTQLESSVREITEGLSEMGIDASVEDGKVNVAANSLAGSIAWNAAQESVNAMAAQINETKKQVASLRKQPPPKDLVAEPGKTAVATPQVVAEAPTQPAETEGTRVRPAGTVPDTPTADDIHRPPRTETQGQEVQQIAMRRQGETGQQQIVQRPGGTAGQATQARPAPPPPKRIEEKQLAGLREQVDEAEQREAKLRGQVSRAEYQADEAKREAEDARAEADYRKKVADDNVATRERQAGEWADLANDAAGRAEGYQERADDLRDQATRLRQQAERYQTLAANTDDKKLAADARTAAANLEADAKDYDKRAAEVERDVASEKETAERRLASSEEVQQDADDLRQRAADADAEATSKEAAAAERQAEVDGLQSDIARADAEAKQAEARLQTAQYQNFNALLKDPPSATFWSDMSSSERSQWMADNVPGWEDMSIDDKIRILRTTDLSEARTQAINAANEFDTYVREHNVTPDEIKERAARIETLQKKIKAKEDEYFISEEDQNELRGLRGQLRRERATLTRDLTEAQRLRDQVVETSREVQRQHWGLDEKARSAEVDRRVNELAETKGQLELARQAATTRDKAFIERLSQERQKLKTARANGDSDAVSAAETAITRLEAAQTEWRALDESNIRTLERIVDDKRGELVGRSIDDKLFELADEEQLDKLAGQRLAQSGALESSATRQNETVRLAVNSVDVTEEEFSVSGAVVKAYDSFTTQVATNVGGTIGVVKGTVKGIYGLADLVIFQPIDSIGESLEMSMEIVTGSRTNFFGTDNQDFVDQVVSDPGGVGSTMFFGLGKQVYDFSQDFVRLGEAAEAGEAGVAFDASMRIGEFVGENVIDPTWVIGGIGKIATVARVADKALDAVHVADKALDAARLAANTGDNVANVATDLARASEGAATLPPPSAFDGAAALPPPSTADAAMAATRLEGPPAGAATLPPPSTADAAMAATRLEGPPGGTSTLAPPPSAADNLAGLPPRTPDAPLPPPDPFGPGQAGRVAESAVPPPVGARAPPSGVHLDAPTNLDAPRLANAAADATPPPAATGNASRPASIAVEAGPQPGQLVLKAEGGGRSVVVNQADFLGEGSFSKTYSTPGQRPVDPLQAVNAGENLGTAVKLTQQQHGAAALDDLGRGAVNAVGDSNVIRTPKIVAQYDVTSSVTVAADRAGVGPKNFANGTVTVVEQTPPAFKDLPAELKMPDGSMTPGQAIAFNRGMEALNKKGFAWLDNKHDNFTFVRSASGKADEWVLVVIDPGGIVPMKGNSLAEKAANARNLQRAVDNPSARSAAGYNGQFGPAMHKGELATDFDGLVAWDDIPAANGKKYSTLDQDLVDPSNSFPYNPVNGTQYPKIGQLAAQTSSEGLNVAEVVLRSQHDVPTSAALPAPKPATPAVGPAAAATPPPAAIPSGAATRLDPPAGVSASAATRIDAPPAGTIPPTVPPPGATGGIPPTVPPPGATGGIPATVTPPGGRPIPPTVPPAGSGMATRIDSGLTKLDPGVATLPPPSTTDAARAMTRLEPPPGGAPTLPPPGTGTATRIDSGLTKLDPGVATLPPPSATDAARAMTRLEPPPGGTPTLPPPGTGTATRIEGPAASAATRIEGPAASAAPRIEGPAASAAPRIEGPAASAATRIEGPAAAAATRIEGPAASAATRIEGPSVSAPTRIETPPAGTAARRTPPPQATETVSAFLDNNARVKGAELDQAMDIVYRRFDGDWKLIDSAVKSGEIGPAKAKLVKALRADMDDLAKLEGEYMARRLRSPEAPVATAEQMSFWNKHPNFGRTLQNGAVDIIRRAADEFGNQAAKAFLAHMEAGNIDVVLSPEVGALGYYQQKVPLPDGTTVKGNAIYVSPYFADKVLTGGKPMMRTLDDMASTMLHEFVHRMGHGELRSWSEQYLFLDQVGRQGAKKIDDAGAYAQAVKADGQISAARALSQELRQRYAPRYDAAKLDLHTRIDPNTFESIPMPNEVDRLQGLDLPSTGGPHGKGVIPGAIPPGEAPGALLPGDRPGASGG